MKTENHPEKSQKTVEVNIWAKLDLRGEVASVTSDPDVGRMWFMARHNVVKCTGTYTMGEDSERG